MEVAEFPRRGTDRRRGRDPGPAQRICAIAVWIAAGLAGGFSLGGADAVGSASPAASDSSSAVPGAIAPDTAQAAADSSRAAADSSRAAADSSRAAADSLASRARTATPAPAPRSITLVPGTRLMADTVTVLPPVDVRGLRGVAPDRTTATSVRVERGKAIRFLPVTVADALVSVPGVDLVKMGPWASQLSLRGLSGDRVLLMVDGVRMNSVRGHGVQPSLVSLDRLDAVELMPGASSAQFGSDALGGVVNIVTQRSLFADRPSASFTLQVRAAEPGQSWSNSARVRLSGRRAGLEVSGGFGALDRLHTPLGALPNSGYREEDLALRGAARIGRASLDLEHSTHDVHDAGLPAFSASVAGGAPTPNSANSGSYPLQRRDAQRLELALQGRGRQPDLRVLGVHQLYYTRFDETVVSNISNSRGRIVGTKSALTSDRVTTGITSVEPSLRFRGAGALRLFGEYRLEQADGPMLRDEVTRFPTGEIWQSTHAESVSVPAADRTCWAAGVGVAPVVRGLKLESSVRYDYLRSRAEARPGSTATLDATDRRTSAEIGVSRLFGRVEPYGHLASGFRAPNLDERYYNSNIHGGLRLFGNPDLVSEQSLSYELGLRTGGDLPLWLRSARISAYRSDVDQLITYRYVGAVQLVPRFQYFNVRQARLEGIEGIAQFRLGSVQVEASGGYPKGTDVATGKALEDVGAARAALEIVCPMNRLLPYGTVSTRVRWSDALTGVSETLRRPAFSTTSIEMSFVTFGTYTVLAVRNLWNHYYYEPQSFIPESGRTFAISLRREFRTGLPF